MEKIGIGLVGYGGIGKVHTLGYKQLPLYYPGILPRITLEGVSTSREETARSAAENGGFRRWFAEVDELISCPDVDVIDCSVPNYAHKAVILAAARAGKHIYCEKPLALDGKEAREIAGIVRESGIAFGMTFHYRFSPAMLRAKQLIDEGALGTVYHFRAAYLHTGYQDPERQLSWRLQKKYSGGGALMDLGSHVIDLVGHLLGEFASVRALCTTYIHERPFQKPAAPEGGAQSKVSRKSEKGVVDVDDAAWLETKLASGAVGTIEVSRFATGTLDDLFLEVYGEKGAFKFSLMDPHFLDWFDATEKGGDYGGSEGWTRLATVQHYPNAVIPPGRAIMGWPRLHAENQFRFLRSVVEGKEPQPGIEDGLRVQHIIDTAYRSVEEEGWVTV